MSIISSSSSIKKFKYMNLINLRNYSEEVPENRSAVTEFYAMS